MEYECFVSILNMGIIDKNYINANEYLAAKKTIAYLSVTPSIGTCLGFALAAVVKKWQNNFIISASFLFVIALAFYVICAKSFESNKNNTYKKIEKELLTMHKGMNYKSLLFSSGLVLMLIVSTLRETIGSGDNYYTPLLLMETSKKITPAIGNGINIIIIALGIVLTLVMEKLYTKFIKNEYIMLLHVFVLTAICSIAIVYYNKVHIVVLACSLAIVYALMNFGYLVINRWTLRFKKYGKEGTVAGIVNGSCSLGIMFANYITPLIVETHSWTILGFFWGISAVLCVFIVVIAKTMGTRFFK